MEGIERDQAYESFSSSATTLGLKLADSIERRQSGRPLRSRSQRVGSTCCIQHCSRIRDLDRNRHGILEPRIRLDEPERDALVVEAARKRTDRVDHALAWLHPGPLELEEGQQKL